MMYKLVFIRLKRVAELLFAIPELWNYHRGRVVFRLLFYAKWHGHGFL